jgi:hypothetical protein
MSFELESAPSSPAPPLTAALGHEEVPPPAVPEPWWQHIRQTAAATTKPHSAAETRAGQEADPEQEAQESLDQFLQETDEAVAMPPPMLPAAVWEWDDDRDAISSTDGFSSDGEALTPLATHHHGCKMPAPPAPPMLMSMDADAMAAPSSTRWQ